MKVAILGTGEVGRALAAGFTKHGHEVKLGHRDGQAELLLALTQKWFSAARHDMVAGTIVFQMLYFGSGTTLSRALWNDCRITSTPSCW